MGDLVEVPRVRLGGDEEFEPSERVQRVENERVRLEHLELGGAGDLRLRQLGMYVRRAAEWSASRRRTGESCCMMSESPPNVDASRRCSLMSCDGAELLKSRWKMRPPALLLM